MLARLDIETSSTNMLATARVPILALRRRWDWLVEAGGREWSLRRSGRAWRKRPGDLSGRVCLLACYVSSDRLPDETVYLAQQWHRNGFKVVVVVATDRFDRRCAKSSWYGDDRLAFVDGMLDRANVGYDFGSWSIALASLGSKLRQTELLAVANDSVLGPFDTFGRLLERVDDAPGDVVGLTESFELRHHVQSYLTFFKSTALRHPAFRRFWRRRRASDRQQTIVESEIVMRDYFVAAGLQVAALFASDRLRRDNPTLVRWHELLESGFPFVKISLLRDRSLRREKDDWPALLEHYGYPRGLTIGHLANLRSATAS